MVKKSPRSHYLWLVLLVLFFMPTRTDLVYAAPLPDDINSYNCAEASSIVSGQWTTNTNPTFNWVANGGTTFQVYFGPDPSGTSSIDQTDLTLSPTVTAEGSNYLRLHSTELSDPWLTCFTYNLDLTDPVMGATENNGVQNNVPQNTVTAPSFNISDTVQHSSPITSFYYYWGTDSSGEDNSTSYTNPSAITPPASAVEGNNYFRVSAIDTVSHQSAWATVFTFIYDSTSPSDVITPAVETHGLDQTGWHNQTQPAFTWSIPDGASSYNIFWGTSPPAALSDTVATSPGVTSNAYTPDLLPSGITATYYLRVQSVDTAGNPGNWVDMFTYHYDGILPSPVTSVTAAVTGDPLNTMVSGQCTIERNVTFTWEPSTDMDSGIAGYYFYWGSNPEGTSVNNSLVSTSLDLTAHKGDKFFFRLASYDAAGNISLWTTEFLLLNGDVVKVVPPVDGGSINLDVPNDTMNISFSFPTDAYQVKIGEIMTGVEFCARMWYPGDHRAPILSKVTPHGHQSFWIAADTTSAENTSISSFTLPSDITFTYPPESALALYENTLKIYHWNGDEWKPLTSSVVDTIKHTITAQTTALGEFLVMGDPIPLSEQLSIQVFGINFGEFPLTGGDIIRTGITTPWIILDATYADLGWYVNIHGSDFSDGNGHKIKIDNMNIQLPQDRITTMIGSATPTTLVPNPTKLSTSDFAIIQSQVGASTGKFSINPIFKLRIPAETYKGTYTSNLVVTIINGPIQ
jgi:hypothetical protein